ncbi:MAG: helix-hairpin-helix domain-containing protein [Anaerolineae bacterium]
MRVDRQMLVALVVGFCLGVIAGVAAMVLGKQSKPTPIVIVPPEPTQTPEPTVTPGPIHVYVNGQVTHPAVYELPPGSDVERAIAAAGGFLADANTAVVNLALPLKNGAQVYVPALAEDAATPETVVTLPDQTVSTGERATHSNSEDMININTATAEELDTLPGIGPSTAQKILDYRDENGPFAAIEDIMKVSGIGEAKFNKIKDLITIGEN